MGRKKERAYQLKNETMITVRFSEVDSMQIVWHGEYVKYMEDGREQFGRQFQGLGYMEMYDSGFMAPIVDMQLQYKRSLRCNEQAIIETRYIATEAAKICFDYVIKRASNGEVVATGSTVQVFIDPEGVLQLIAPTFYTQWKEKWGIQ